MKHNPPTPAELNNLIRTAPLEDRPSQDHLLHHQLPSQSDLESMEDEGPSMEELEAGTMAELLEQAGSSLHAQSESLPPIPRWYRNAFTNT